jgi:hypothetical protein
VNKILRKRVKIEFRGVGFGRVKQGAKFNFLWFVSGWNTMMFGHKL